MSYTLLPPPKIQFIGSNGAPLAGGKVYTYSPGTTTAKATYTTSSGTANTNPVILDSAGRASIWLDGIYKISVYDSNDVLQYTIDNVSAPYGDSTATSAELSTLHGSGITNADLIIAHTMSSMYLGYAKRSKFSWTDADTITIGPGVYHHSGTTDQMVYWASTLTLDMTVSGTRWYYIYIDDSAIVSAGVKLLTATQFTYSITAPTWSDAKQGLYNGSDRCIFAVHVTSDSIDAFFHDGGDYLQYKIRVTDRTSSDLASRASTSLTIPAFCTRALCYFWATMNGVYTLYVAPADVDGIPVMDGVAATGISEMHQVITSATQTIYLALSNYTGTNNVHVSTVGWFFPTGM